MPNPLDQVTEDQSDQPLRRIYINGDGMPSDTGSAMQPALSPDNRLVQAVAPAEPSQLEQGLAALKEYLTNPTGFSPGTRVGNRLTGAGGEQRYQTWPERMVREGLTAPGDVLARTEPSTSESLIEPAMATSALTGGSALAERPGAATLGSGPVRPGMKPVMPTEPAPVFYSALEHATTNASQDTMSPQQWLGYLKNQPGVKKEELDWTGLESWLGQQKGKVKKEDVQSYLEANKTEIKDVTKTGPQASDLVTDDLHDRATDAVVEAFHARNPHMVGQEHTTRYQNALERYGESRAGEEIYNNILEAGFEPKGATRYSSYQLPGGENYREHLLTMPEKPRSTVGWTAKEYNKNSYDVRDAQGKEVGSFVGHDTPESAIAHAEMYDRTAPERAQSRNYRSSHWDEPNVLAHVRTNDRDFHPSAEQYKAGIADVVKDYKGWLNKNGLPEMSMDEVPRSKLKPEQRAELDDFHKRWDEVSKPVKSLHIEEIQSDWHQQGRKQGYKSDDAGKAYDDYMANLRERIKDDILKTAKQHGISDERAQVLAAESLRKMQPHEMARFFGEEPQMKALWDAKVAGDAGVPDAPFKTTWPELALKRMIRHAAENGYDRISWTPGEAQAARYDLSKSISKVQYGQGNHLVAYDHAGNRVMDGFHTPEELPNIVGKDVAEKLVNAEEKTVKDRHGGDTKTRELSGLDLKVGGEGMREFYDKMLPKMAEKVGKAHGVKVKTGKLPVNTNVRGGEAMNVPPKEIYETLSEHDPKLKEQFPTVSDFVDYYNDLNSEHRADLIASARSKGTTPVHYFDLPQSLKDHAVGKGFPLYMSGLPFPLTPVDHDPFEKKK